MSKNFQERAYKWSIAASIFGVIAAMVTIVTMLVKILELELPDNPQGEITVSQPPRPSDRPPVSQSPVLPPLDSRRPMIKPSNETRGEILASFTIDLQPKKPNSSLRPLSDWADPPTGRAIPLVLYAKQIDVASRPDSSR